MGYVCTLPCAVIYQDTGACLPACLGYRYQFSPFFVALYIQVSACQGLHVPCMTSIPQKPGYDNQFDGEMYIKRNKKGKKPLYFRSGKGRQTDEGRRMVLLLSSCWWYGNSCGPGPCLFFRLAGSLLPASRTRMIAEQNN